MAEIGKPTRLLGAPSIEVDSAEAAAERCRRRHEGAGVADRIHCCVPFCRRTAPRAKMPDASEMICAKCGRRAPRERKLWRAVHRHAERQGCRLSERQWRRYVRVWDRFKAAVIAAAAP